MTAGGITFGADAAKAKAAPVPPARKWGTNTRPAPPPVPTATKPTSSAPAPPAVASKQAVGARGGGFGMDAELAAKAAAKYDVGMEQEAAAWITAVTGIEFSGSFADSLKDGQMLCILINNLKPGTIRKVETSKMPFKQMENISNFLKASRTMGVAEHDCFETVDLFEQKDLGVVVMCLHSLGRK